MPDRLPISVIIPVFNRAAYLEEALLSVLAEHPAQVIVIDDGSTDGSGERAQAHGFPVHVLRQENAGAAAARNFGLDTVQQPHVYFMDSDDLLQPGALARLMRGLATNPDAQACRGLVRYFMDAAEGDKRVGRRLGEPVENATISAALFRADFISLVGPFSVAMQVGSDLDWMKRAIEVGLQTVEISEVVLLVRRHTRNLTTDRAVIHKAFFDIVRRSITRRRGEGEGR